MAKSQESFETVQEIRLVPLDKPAQLQIPIQLDELISIEDTSSSSGHFVRNLLLFAGVLALAGGAFLLSRRQNPNKELKAARLADLTRLAGTWYEIARMPGQVDEQAFDMRVIYSLRGSQELDVEYVWRSGSFSAPEQRDTKKLRIEDPTQPAKMKKQLLGALEIDYWLIEIGKQDEYVVFGTPSHQHVWILSRSPQLDQKLYQSILNRLQHQGFETSRLERVAQRASIAPAVVSPHAGV